LKKNNIKINSNRSFGVVFFLFFLIVSVYPLLNDGNIRTWSLVVSIIFLFLGLLNSSILYPLNKAWFKFGILLGSIISPIIMGFIFFTVVTLTSFIMKLLGKDLLNLKKSKNKSYWIEKSKIKSEMKNQF
tara:strand:- start:105 stop:494 length:390 start_codon:yes stop_codon:yes gene_type:complete